MLSVSFVVKSFKLNTFTVSPPWEPILRLSVGTVLNIYSFPRSCAGMHTDAGFTTKITNDCMDRYLLLGTPLRCSGAA